MILMFEDDPSRKLTLERWQVQREAWIVNEKPACEAMRIFEQLNVELRGKVEIEK